MLVITFNKIHFVFLFMDFNNIGMTLWTIRYKIKKFIYSSTHLIENQYQVKVCIFLVI